MTVRQQEEKLKKTKNKKLINMTNTQWHPTPVLLPGKPHGRRSLVGCSPWGREESDPTERLHFHFSLSCIGEGNGNPLQCSCLENPRDGGAWWAAVYGVAQSRTLLKQLSSSSSSNVFLRIVNLKYALDFIFKAQSRTYLRYSLWVLTSITYDILFYLYVSA